MIGNETESKKCMRKDIKIVHIPTLSSTMTIKHPKKLLRLLKDLLNTRFPPKQQWLHLVEKRWPALLNGEKTSTFRLNEGFIHKGFLVYKDSQKNNAPRYKDIWRQYRSVAHLIEALQIMKMQYLELTGDPIPFEAFLALVLDHLNLAAYQQGEELKKMQEGHTKKPIVPADEFYAIEKPKLAENELATALVKECLLTDPSLSKKISKYRAPVFDYGNFVIPSDN